MKSVMSFPNRGPWGKSSWRGNTSGHVIKEMIEHFNPKLFVDACEGSGTSGDVCRDMGIDYVGLDLYKGQDFTKDDILTQLPRPADIVFTHPPYHCLHPDSLVVQYNGTVKKISEIRTGDKVLNKNGEIVDVIAVAKKKNTKKMYKLKTRNMMIDELNVTEDHRVLVLEASKCKYKSQNKICQSDCIHPSNEIGSCTKGDAPYHDYETVWKEAKDIKTGDCLLYIAPKKQKFKTDSVSISDFLVGDWYTLNNGYIWYQKNKSGTTKRKQKCQYGLKNTFALNKEVSYLFGLFCAEGSAPLKTDGGTIYFSFHRDEVQYIESVKNTMLKYFGIECSNVRNMKDSNGVRVEFYSKPLAMFFSKAFGNGARNKKIPDFIMFSNEAVKLSFLRGLLHGDGCKASNSFDTTSRNLIEQVKMICISMGYVMSAFYSTKANNKTTRIHNNKKDTVIGNSYYGQFPKGLFSLIYDNNLQKWHDKAIRFEDKIGFVVKEVECYDYDGMVYDIQVSKGESFLTPHGIVHNCMIEYSGNVYGDKPIYGDTSRCVSPEEFIAKSQVMLLNQREATREGGIYATLIGDHRGGTLGRGNFRSYQADFIQMMPKDELLSVTIKLQHNCLSDTRQYSGNFVPIMHEYLLLWKKSAKSLFAVSFDIASEMTKRVATTWRNAIRMVMMKLKEAKLSDIYAEVEKVAGSLIANNPNYKAKIRQTLQKHFKNVERGVWAVA